MSDIYDPRSLEYETVCETIGHLYLERCHYERQSAQILSKANDLSSQINELNAQIDIYKERIEHVDEQDNGQKEDVKNESD